MSGKAIRETQYAYLFRRILTLYGSPRGRINRKKYLLWFAIPLGVPQGLLFGAFLFGIVGPPELGLTLVWWTRVGFAWPEFVGLAKRLQDFGAPGVPVSGVFACAFVLGPLARPDGIGLLGVALRWLSALVALFALFTKGEPGENRYGPDPLEVG